MLQRAIRVAGLIGVISLGLIAGQAGATVNGACSGSGTVTATGLQPATYTSSNFVASTLIKMPTAGSVQWSGTDSGWHGGRRAIGGEIYVDAPFGQHITEGSWGKTSTRTGNSGVKTYSFGSIADNVKATVAGYHDDAGHTTCSGSVNIQFDGSTFSNPLAAGSIAGIVVFGALLLLSGRAKA
jgi:hypothetical protein